MTNQTSPFAPVDIPDVNSIPAPSAMPPMAAMPPVMEETVMVDMPMPTAQPQDNTQASSGAQDTSSMGQDAATLNLPVMPKVAKEQDAMQDVTQNAVSDQVSAQSAASVSASVSTPASDSVSAPKVDERKTQEQNKTERSEPVAKPVSKPQVKEFKNGQSVGKPTQSVVRDVEVATASLVQAPKKKSSVTIEPLLEECIRQNASDLHLQAGLPPILRVDGVLRPITTYPAFDNSTVQELVFSTLDADQKVILMKDKEFDYSFAFGDLGRFRVNAFQEQGNMAAAFRLIPNVIRSIQELGIPAVVEDFANHPNGLVLVTGPTGSGKSTTLAALIDKINTERADHIITIEDPIEFTHRSKRSLVAQREVHYDTYSFASALRSILREDPDVVLIGEMRDLETIQAAITVAETGHLVFATLHTNSAAQSIDRMVDVFPAHQQPQVRAQLANILVGICSQRLIPSINGGRVAVSEILVTNSAVQAIIREGKTHQLDTTIQTGMSQGMQTMDRELAKFVKEGIIAYDVAKSYAVNVAEFDRLARG